MILNRLIRDFAAIAPRWVAACIKAKGIAEDSPTVAEEWGAGVWPVMKNLRQLRQSLADIASVGHPKIPGKITTRSDGQVVARVFPLTGYDRLFFIGLTAEVWMEPGVTAETLSQTQALTYRNKNHHGKVALVLGAGNVGSIGPMDILYKMFVEDQVVILKMNPVNAYLGPLIQQSFQALVEPGFLRVVYGGASEGAYLCNHPQVDEVHITGSDKTFDAIVFGSGSEGAARKANQALLVPALVMLVGVLVQEGVLLDMAAKKAPTAIWAIAVVIAVLVGFFIDGIRFAVFPALDPLGLSERGRRIYVYASEVLLVRMRIFD